MKNYPPFMNISIRTLLVFGFMAITQLGISQELLCNVSINSGRIQSDKTVFDNMRETITQYVNFQKWTNDEFTGQERIRCNMQIIINQRPSPDYFTASLTMQVYRPVYNTNYETLLINIQDNLFNFSYVPFQQMTYNENTYTDNLTALLNYYVFIALGFDYGSYAPNGGDPYFRKAQEIVNVASSSANEKGWRAGESDRNRYWLVENLLNSRYKGFHTVLYKYHRDGLDKMESDPNKARRAILDSVKEMQRVARSNPLLMLSKTFTDAKHEELTKVFTKAFVNDKKEFLQIMQELDPAHSNEYNSIMSG
ncbi:MAG: DUF4835 family protein [Bacteroidota bacterium]